MFRQHPSPITNENFPEVWTYTDKKLRRLKAAAAANQAACWIGNLLFCACCTVAVYGMLTTHESSGFRAYLDSIAVLKDIWAAASAFIFDPEKHGLLQAFLYILCLYGIPFAGAAIVTLLIRAVYHPRRTAMPTGTPAENAELLLKRAQRVQNLSQKIRNGNSAAFAGNTLFLILCGALISGYIMEIIASEDSSHIMSLNPMSLTLVTMGTFLTYAAVNYIFSFMLMPLSYVHVPHNLAGDAEHYRIESDPEFKARLEEEERILKLAREIQERRKQEQERLRSR